MKVVVVYGYDKHDRRQTITVFSDQPLEDVAVLWERSTHDFEKNSEILNGFIDLREQYSECFEK